MKIKILSLFIILFNHHGFAQQKPGRNSVNEQQKKHTTKAKIHANSNSVFGTGNTHPKYDKKAKTGKVVSKREEDIQKDKKGKK